MKPTKHSVAFVIYNSNYDKFLIVQRPPDDDLLPNVWGLPAGSLNEGEIFEDAVIRAAMDKLGVKVEVIGLVGEGELERGQYILHMKEFEAKIANGTPSVPQNVSGVTQYSKWKWGMANDLIEAAQKGSLCSRLYLKSINKSW
ncbi:MAG: NUDIX domain-containing protein [Patescibacteria group bacterium]|jgi:ADP-ribose pyrophosphatase YjhB (NUDIX family)